MRRIEQGNEGKDHSWQEDGISKGTEVRMFMRMSNLTRKKLDLGM